MRTLTVFVVCAILCVCFWRVASIISPDAISMAVGMLFGVFAGIPTALLMLASNRKSGSRDFTDEELAAHGIQRQAPAPVVILYSNSNRTNNIYVTGDEAEKLIGTQQPDLRYSAITTTKR